MNSPTHLEKRQIFERHPVFGKLSAGEIDSLISYARIERYPAGREIFAKGSPGTSLMAVLRGSIKISSLSNEGKEIVFAIISAGDIFGEIAVLDGEERSADATALTDCELMVITRRDFIPVLRREPDVALKLIEILCARIRRTSEQVEDVMYLSFPAHLAKTLLELTGGLEASAAQRNVRITQRELGNIVGMSRESTNKHLRAWKERKWVGLARGGIVVTNAGALRKLIGEEIQTTG